MLATILRVLIWTMYSVLLIVLAPVIWYAIYQDKRWNRDMH
jgi:hypothetical protein